MTLPAVPRQKGVSAITFFRAIARPVAAAGAAIFIDPAGRRVILRPAGTKRTRRRAATPVIVHSPAAAGVFAFAGGGASGHKTPPAIRR